jgi:hypothetical protein
MFDLENFVFEFMYNYLNVYTLEVTCECINENKKVVNVFTMLLLL